MANAAERGGGTRTPTVSASDALARQRAGERAAFGTPKPVVRKKKRPSGGLTVSGTLPIYRRKSSSGHNNSNNRTSSSNNRRRSSSSNQRRAPVAPPRGDSKVVKPVSPPVPPKPVAPSNANWLRSDTTYQRQLAAYNKSLQDFQADQGLARTDYEQNYQGQYRDIGLAKADASKNLENDYASRGLLQSSLYNQGLTELNSQYQNQYNDLAKQRTAFLAQLGQELAKYNNEQGTQKQNAQQEALRRRAEKYNL